MRKTKSKSSLFLMELIIAILIFSVCAAVCMQVFAAAKRASNQSSELSHAVMCAQSAVETYKAASGDLEEAARLFGAELAASDEARVSYGGDWQRTDGEAAYTLSLIVLDDGTACAQVQKAGEAELIYSLLTRAPGGAGQ